MMILGSSVAVAIAANSAETSTKDADEKGASLTELSDSYFDVQNDGTMIGTVNVASVNR
jgi:hypothetical protein